MSTHPMHSAKMDYNVSMRYPDSKVSVKLASKKNGASLPQFIENMHMAGYHYLEVPNLVKLYERGDIDANITSLRKVFDATSGEWGLSKTGALRCYKLIFSKLPKNVVRRPTFDNFSKRDFK